MKKLEAELTSCSKIDSIGYLAPTLKTKNVFDAAKMVQNGLSAYHIEVDGEEVQLQPASSEDSHREYLRALDTDEPDDPLLQLPTIQEYKRQNEKGQWKR